MILHLYFARRFAINFAAIFAGFLVFLLLLDVVDQIRKFEIGTISFGQALELALLNAPKAIYRILPLIVILTTLALYLGLARTSEMVITRAAGRSALRSLIAPVISALVLGAILVGLFNPIVAATSATYKRLSANYESGSQNTLSISREGLWLRQATAEGQMVIHAAEADNDGAVLGDVTFMSLDARSQALFRIKAESAVLVEGAWQLTNAKRWDLGPEILNPEQSSTLHATLTLASDLTADRIRDSFGEPSDISFWELPTFIRDLERAGFTTRRHVMWQQMELALPLLFVAMVLLGASLTMRHSRFGRTGTMVLTALGLGLGLFFMRNFAQVLGENGQIPILLAAWGPPVAGILLAMSILLHLEDG
ncbi:LPS export ABC transporter permease LptG [Actibacterium pelagium]|uniref:LPS export ABC transporter permease LptG n=1 Tax=Actibacterium pelagium TaxID=2029103 RepID=A0A917AD49_9RHOB|nr:LPS export ABC transporter permease LptG [Actibacterium pelagium]GGE44727.1 LPS export ABC transporter permease LptG [Actibacterium pelagium]